MNDKDLLELAAKAAGYLVVDGHVHMKNGQRIKFRPLTDDGDALRLAVKLGIRILHPSIESETGYPNAICAGTFYACEFTEMHEADPYAATRRAIVRAAAEIGRAMP